MSIYDSLNPQQQEAVYCTEGPLLILAGAGSGKTRVLTHRISYLIEEKGINPWNIMAITFTNKAAGEMKERVEHTVTRGADSVWVSTFHSSCVRILRRYIDRIGYGTSFTIYDSDDSKSVMKEVCKTLNIDTKLYKERMLLSAVSSAKNEMISPEDYERNIGGEWSKKTIARAYREYQNRLKKSNALDFDDLLVKTVELFEKCPEVLEYYQERFRYLMVDEYQDTNTVQFRFVSLLAGKYRNLCVVGDDDQSIYKFRGADIGNILGFEKVFPDAKVIRLEQNYRSTQNILDAANEVIRNNMERKEKTLWTDNEKGYPVRFRQFLNAFEEAEFIAGDIRKLVREGDAAYKDFAILYRTNAQSRLFEEKFLMANIPYRLVGGVNFYARKEIKDLLAYLKTIDNAQDDLAVRRIINVPKRGIGAATLMKVQMYATERDMSFYEALEDEGISAAVGRSGSKLVPFVSLIQRMRSQLEYLSVSELLTQVIEETGYVKELEAEGTDESRARIENIDELLTKAVTYEEEHETPTLDGFLEEVALIADIDTVEDGDDRVLLMTLHSAKGLEFAYVYMAGMEDGIFPSYMTITSDDPSEIEEERRLCYVGITRAMRGLTLTSAQQRMIRGETQYNKVSRFIREIPRELVDVGHEIKERESKADQILASSSYRQMKEAFRAQVFQPQQFKVTKAERLDYTVGDTVRHVKFGTGVVESVVEGGKDFEVTVNFEKYGIKKMFAAFAKLKKIPKV
ncbi:DNA helicase PcrA [Ruminococcus gauvreauii]|uniref:ATP-dependent DNA helicase n=1 Tax=Ruminococcus gauvreauii TaxID=438033 RepID=A0ABY5VIR7_9FIRM|nr:DNA helicase PcrA [Ruminococcus gauvreauii]UWP60207.1 DNA helicase PcrA [Ruminococcus gauvreauii]